MKYWSLITLTFILIPAIGFTASIEARPFDFEFTAPQDLLDVNAQLQLSCRYEKFVIGDSAEYNTTRKSYDLDIQATNLDERVRYRISLTSTLSHEVRGFFRPNKECAGQLKISLNDNNYAVGWVGKVSTPISFFVQTSAYRYNEGHSSLDISEVLDVIKNRHVSFRYKPVPNLQVNIWVLFDGSTHRSLLPTSAAINPETNAPYLLHN
jgi:hypothetical protein